MQIKEDKQDDVMVVTVSEHLDSATASVFESRLLGLVERGERRIVVDCGLLDYVSQRHLRAATLRRDGFASLTDQWPPGAPRLAAQGAPRITTRPIKFSGQHLFVNAGIDGSICVEVLDVAGRVIEPFTLEGCVPVSGDGTRLAVKWKGAPTLSMLSGQVVRLRFTLARARLFSFWISPSAAGESRGYLAAGGPGYTRPTDSN